MSAPLLEVRDLCKEYSLGGWLRPKGVVKALGGVSFSLNPGETLAVVGESGCGKTTLAKLLLGVERPTAGEILWNGKRADEIAPKQFRRQVQMVFQDPYGSLNPRKRAWQIVAEPLRINGAFCCKEQVLALLEQVGIRRELADRFPHMFSGGQRQRIGIARALALQPRVLVCDEPVSALDVSIQAQILNLLQDLQQSLGLAYVFISHDLSVVRHLAHRVMVINLGRVVEEGPAEAVFRDPRDAYTRQLLASRPSFAVVQ